MQRPLLVATAIVLLAGSAAGFLLWRQQQPAPSVAFESPPAWLGHAPARLVVAVTVPTGALHSVSARVVQGDSSKDVVLTLEQDLQPAADGSSPQAGPEQRFTAELEAAALGLKEGEAEISVEATDDAWRPKAVRSAPVTQRFTVDLTPPIVELQSFTGYVKHGGAVCVVYRMAEAGRSGLEVGENFFPGHAGISSDAALHVALAALPFDMEQTPPKLVAEDAAGNRRIVSVPVTFLPSAFGTDTASLTEQFLRRKVPELDPQTPGDATTQDFLARFLVINGEGRKQAEERIRAAASAPSANHPLWSGAFKQQSNSKVFAGFPQRRTYLFDGKKVDEQWHLGLDLGSNKRVPVEASGGGRVFFTGPLGIYGNTVILDHGLGLSSLYGHMSEIAVTPGQSVAQGESLGRSGETGFAAGDHVHFAMLVNGVYTNPIEWWDAGWIRDRFALPLADAGLAVPGITDIAAQKSAPKAAAPTKKAGGRRR